jgi:hypothetical protein
MPHDLVRGRAGASVMCPPARRRSGFGAVTIAREGRETFAGMSTSALQLRGLLDVRREAGASVFKLARASGTRSIKCVLATAGSTTTQHAARMALCVLTCAGRARGQTYGGIPSESGFHGRDSACTLRWPAPLGLGQAVQVSFSGGKQQWSTRLSSKNLRLALCVI